MATAAAAASRSNANNKYVIFSQITTGNKLRFRIPRVSRKTSFAIARALDPKREAPNPNSDDRNLLPIVPREDLEYLVKLGGASMVGAAAIKYGSVIFPAITKPNLVEALAIITVPVVVAVALLIKQSGMERR